MAGLDGSIIISHELRPCVFRGQRFMFHQWFEEGGFDSRGQTMEGSIDVGAILEDISGHISKQFAIAEIQFVDVIIPSEVLS